MWVDRFNGIVARVTAQSKESDHLEYGRKRAKYCLWYHVTPAAVHTEQPPILIDFKLVNANAPGDTGRI